MKVYQVEEFYHHQCSCACTFDARCPAVRERDDLREPPGMLEVAELWTSIIAQVVQDHQCL